MVYSKAEKIAEYIKSRIQELPEIAIVLGSGLGGFADCMEKECTIPYKEIEGFPVSTVKGHAGKLIFGKVAGRTVVAMQGRFHLYEGYRPDEVTLPIRVFQLLGIKKMILTNAAGAVNRNWKPGDFMLIEDHISLFCPSPLWGKNEDEFGERFPSMSEVYDKDWINKAESVAKRLQIPVRKGVYCYCKGPMYETPAEIRLLEHLGADAVGMSTVMEAIVAIHGGMRVLGISCLTNMAAGILDQPLSHEEVMEVGRKVEIQFIQLLQEMIVEM